VSIGTLAPGRVIVASELPEAERSRTWRKLSRNPAAIAGALILLIVIAAAVAAPYVAPHDPMRQSLLRRFTPPVWLQGGNPSYPLGTDQVGRDILSRIIYGARVSLVVGIAAVAVSLVVGVTLGLLSGFLRGRVDAVIMTVVDVTLSFPQLLLALAFVAALGPSLATIIVVLGLTGWERSPAWCGPRYWLCARRASWRRRGPWARARCAPSCGISCPTPFRPSS